MNNTRESKWLSSILTPFVSLSYPTEPPAEPDSFPGYSYYKGGILDLCLLVTCIAVMAILRDALRLGVCEPFARWYLTRQLRKSKAKQIAHANGRENNANPIEKKNNGAANGNGTAKECAVHTDSLVVTKREARQLRHGVIRFAEQGWPFVYYFAQCAYGLWIHFNLPTRVMDPVGVWINYPHIPLAAPFKFYYLTQCAFYLHQILILNAEARRKDHWQMMTHHVITVALMLGSYYYNYTRVGALVMVLMDLPDIFLPLAKMLRYLGLQTLCDTTFASFMLFWFICRHFLFVFTIKSAYSDAPRIIPLIWDPTTGHFMTKGVYIAFNSLLVSLEIIQIMWFYTICRIAYRVVSGQGADDMRSDSEDSTSEDEGEKKDR